jgi:invasion associated locus B (IalB) protein
MPRRRDYLCAMITNRLLFLGAILLIAQQPFALAAKKPQPQPAPAAAAATSADPGPAKPLGSAGSWNAFVAQNKAGKVCYLVGAPEKSEPAGVKRTGVMAMVTHRTADNVSNVVSFDAGYPLNENDDVSVEIGRDKFPLFAKDDTAWARTSELDKTIVSMLAKEKEAIVKGTPAKGHPTVDTYSLVGFSKALALIDKACDVKR